MFPTSEPYAAELYTDIGEPIMTADGAVLRLLEDRDGDLNIRMQDIGQAGSSTSWYPRDFVIEQGDGNFYRGAAAIARGHIEPPDSGSGE